VSAQPLININAEDNNKREEEVKDNNTEELEPPLLPLIVVHFISIWKAFNKKEVLPST
jgi:hypothetical protein